MKVNIECTDASWAWLHGESIFDAKWTIYVDIEGNLTHQCC